MPDLIRNSSDRYSWLAITLHWTMAVALSGMFALGLWMVELDYYDPWYRDAPDLHRSIGILLVLALIVRFALRVLTPVPKLPEATPDWVARLSALTHWLFYLLVLVIALAGYLMSTADERPVSVFGWFEVPATYTALANQEDVMGEIHEWLAYGLAAMVVLHVLAALKHHFIDKDFVLRRMLGLQPRANDR